MFLFVWYFRQSANIHCVLIISSYKYLMFNILSLTFLLKSSKFALKAKFKVILISCLF